MELTEKIVQTSLYEGRSHMSKSGRKRWSQHVLWDDSLPGFGLRISSTNRKSFIVAYRAGGRKRTKALGLVDNLTLAEARKRAAELLDTQAEEQAGAGPAAIEGVETVAQLADTYLERHLKQNVPSWFADQRLMRNHLKPALGRSRIAEVSQTDLANLRARVGRTFPADSRRLKSLLSGMFGWAAEHGLWSKSSREASSAVPLTEPAAAAEGEPQTASPPSAEELMNSLQSSEERRRELASRLDEVSSSGVEMLAKLNEKAEAEKELVAELAISRRQLEKAQQEAASRPDPEKVEGQMANLRLSVEQLMGTQGKAEGELRETTEKLAAAEARANAQTKKVAALVRARNELETRALEMERKAAVRNAQQRSGGQRRFGWLAAGAIGGALVTLLLLVAFGPDGTPPPPAAADPAGPAITAGAGGASVADLGPAQRADADAVPTGSAPSAASEGGEVSADPDAVEEAVRSWAAAWSGQRVDDYLAAYSRAFVPPNGMRRSEWASQRQNRILRPASIRVEVGDLNRALVSEDRVRVSFEQSYETETYADQILKTLELVWEDGSWKILTEQAG